MRDVMDALTELRAANEAIETAGPLYQTREPLKDKIVRLIGQRSDLITQVLALRRELNAARAEVEKLRALPSAEDLEESAHEILDGAGIPTHALDPVSGEEDYRASFEERLEWTVEEIARTRIENARLRAALRLAEGPIVIAASYADQPCETIGMRIHAKDCARILPEIHAALAGEGETKRCAWTYDETHCAWDSSCGEKLILEDGGPNENRIRFCHSCGKQVEVV